MLIILLILLIFFIIYFRKYLIKRRCERRYSEKFENNVINRVIDPVDNQIVSIYAYRAMDESNKQLSDFMSKLNGIIDKLKGEMMNKPSEEANFFYIRQKFENGNNLIYQFDTKITINDNLYNKIVQYHYYIGNNRFTINLFVVNTNNMISNIYYDIVELQKYRNYDEEYNLYDKYYHYVDLYK